MCPIKSLATDQLSRPHHPPQAKRDDQLTLHAALATAEALSSENSELAQKLAAQSTANVALEQQLAAQHAALQQQAQHNGTVVAQQAMVLQYQQQCAQLAADHEKLVAKNEELASELWAAGQAVEWANGSTAAANKQLTLTQGEAAAFSHQAAAAQEGMRVVAAQWEEERAALRQQAHQAAAHVAGMDKERDAALAAKSASDKVGLVLPSCALD